MLSETYPRLLFLVTKEQRKNTQHSYRELLHLGNYTFKVQKGGVFPPSIDDKPERHSSEIN